MPASTKTLVKSALVNWLPWSLLKISGLPYRANVKPYDPDGIIPTVIGFDRREPIFAFRWR
jgi:hypothetical protein